ncbi:MAG: hypothetical protein KDB01_04880, partial [Planctomycetaceae bacterium]|nr:hypothetical protein [Planctomycetaceae bacterium]
LYVHFASRLSHCAVGSIHDAADARPLLVAVVPGAFYREHPEVGADGRELIELSAQQAWDCERIPTESLGTPLTNAKIINSYLSSALQRHRVILVSLSKGTTDAGVAQALRPDLFQKLAAWVSVSGVGCGTLMADWLLDKWYLRPILGLMLWRHGADRQAVSSMRYNSAQTFKAATDETQSPIVHIAGFPLQKHLSCRRARLWHRRFRTHGPNDSVVLLQDLLKFPGTVIPVWGADHYLRAGRNAAERVTQLIAMLDGNSEQNPDIHANSDPSLRTWSQFTARV